MMTYEAYSSAEEFDVYSTLELGEDGNFGYYESWSSYGGGFGHAVRGVWRQSGNLIFLRSDYVEEGWMRIDWVKQKECQASVYREKLIFDGSFTMSLKREEPRPAIQSAETKAEPTPAKAQENAVSASGADRKKPSPAVAKLRFKDGRIRQIQAPSDAFPGLFDVTFYRLVDETGQIVNLFKLRQDSEIACSTVLEFDEIDFNPTEESNDS